MLKNTFMPKAKPRVWNIAFALLLILAFLSFILPLCNNNLQIGFTGNIFSTIWGIWLTAIVGWLYVKRFRAEKFKAIAKGFNLLYYDLKSVANELIGFINNDIASIKNQFTVEFISQLHEYAEKIKNDTIFYSKYLEFCDLNDLKVCYEATQHLATINKYKSDTEFMYYYSISSCAVYLRASRIAGVKTDKRTTEMIIKSINKWQDLYEKEITLK